MLIQYWTQGTCCVHHRFASSVVEHGTPRGARVTPAHTCGTSGYPPIQHSTIRLCHGMSFTTHLLSGAGRVAGASLTCHARTTACRHGGTALCFTLS
jgi:hypothetical protein